MRFELTQALKAPNALAVRPLDQLEYLSNIIRVTNAALLSRKKVTMPNVVNASSGVCGGQDAVPVLYLREG